MHRGPPLRPSGDQECLHQTPFLLESGLCSTELLPSSGEGFGTTLYGGNWFYTKSHTMFCHVRYTMRTIFFSPLLFLYIIINEHIIYLFEIFLGVLHLKFSSGTPRVPYPVFSNLRMKYPDSTFSLLRHTHL